jgi:aspartyl aminopeptidase
MADIISRLLHYIQTSPTSFHAATNGASLLGDHGFTRLYEQDSWQNLSPGTYFILRNSASLIAFVLGDPPPVQTGFRMAGAHTDSPGLKLKPNPILQNRGTTQLGVEIYGGALLAPWFDRDLSLAGKVIWQTETGELISVLLDCKEPIAIIPSLAIHFDADANKNRTINRQNEMVPICALADEDNHLSLPTLLQEFVSKQYPDLPPGAAVDGELFFYDCQPPALIGLRREFISSARLDNLLSCFLLLDGIVANKGPENSLIVLNDHEEVGSLSTTGAQGPFLQNVLERLLPDTEERNRCLARSIFLSVDNAHAVHPNYSDKHDDNHLPRLNRGPVIKQNANQRYASSADTASFFRALCAAVDVDVQPFVMRNDLACGSTIGPLTAGNIGVRTVDIGLPTLAMHSVRELAGSRDPVLLSKVLKYFYSIKPTSSLWQGLAR